MRLSPLVLSPPLFERSGMLKYGKNINSYGEEFNLGFSKSSKPKHLISTKLGQKSGLHQFAVAVSRKSRTLPAHHFIKTMIWCFRHVITAGRLALSE